MSTTTNQSPLNLPDIKAVVADMDGVIWRGPEILPGVPDLFLFLRDHNIPYAMATNNSTQTRAEYVARLTSLKIPITEDAIVTRIQQHWEAGADHVCVQTIDPDQPVGPLGIANPDQKLLQQLAKLTN